MFLQKHENIINIIIFTFAFLAVFSCGRMHQVKIDREVLNAQNKKYESLKEEYQEYKKHSYILHGDQ